MNASRIFVAGLVTVVVTGASAIAKDEPFLLRFTDEVATTAGIGLLKSATLPAGSSEIRIWIGFGVVMPDEMLRLQRDSQGEIVGEVLVYYPSDLTYMKANDAKRFRRNIMRNCTNLRKGGEKDVCTATFKSVPNWIDLYSRLAHLGIATLPDESELANQEIVVNDGVAMVVEVRNGSDYRAYGYSNPSFRDEAEAQSAAQIIRVVSDAIRH
jgi:hypothetical protein